MAMPASTINHSVAGTCFAHVPPVATIGTIVSGASTVNSEKLPAARQTDTVVLACGHTATIVTGSPTVFVEGIVFARITDTVVSSFIGIITSGCQTVNAA